MLFVEASVEQMEEVYKVMKEFCLVSGHKVNLAKSKMYCSRNIHYQRAVELSRRLGIGLTADLGKYLGVPLLHSRVTKATYIPIVQKVKNRLSSWKSRFLSMAGRTILIKSVISTLPSYQMQSTLLPKNILEEIEKISRSFLWSQDEGLRKMHLFAWDSIKRSKRNEGLGIKDLCRQNKAFILKLCWNLVTKPNSLWVKVVKNKYRCGEGMLPKGSKKSNSLATWTAISKVWDVFMQGLSRKIRGGESTRFWWDKWANLDRPIIEYANPNMMVNGDETVREHTNDNGSWAIEKWQGVLPNHIISTILKMRPPLRGDEDRFMWRLSKYGAFTVKSAYDFLATNETERGNLMWSKIWRWQIPEKVKMFMWQISYERIAINSLRAKRGLSESSLCPYECQREESVIHLLRDCKRARELWLNIIHPNFLPSFFSGDLQVWLKWNSNHNPGRGKFSQAPWSRTFSIFCWLLWTSRCKFLFEKHAYTTKEIIHCGLYWLLECISNNEFCH